MKTIIGPLLGLLACTLSSLPAAVTPPETYGPVPSKRQLAWHDLEFYGFVHFTVNTFTDKEWGYGDEDPLVFNPTDFDADQIAATAKMAGMGGLILTAKHHDGFCLWPSRYTEHSVRNSTWKNGKGDVVKEMAAACRRHGLKFGVYLSPWDRNHKNYASPEYVTYYRQQLRELLTNYGDLFMVWFDGANGGDGFYGGAREKRNIDNRTFYDWPNTWSIVRELMPGAVMFSDAGPDVRWVGNENGFAGDPCWATMNLSDRYPGGRSDGLNSGERPGTAWLPAECDVSIRPGWFYHAKEDSRVKTPGQLMDIYFKSVGRGACLNLNLPPDRRGQIHENDVAALREFRRQLDLTFKTNLVRKATVTASGSQGGAAKTGLAKLADGRKNTYWTPNDWNQSTEITFDFGKTTSLNVADLREYLPAGQRVEVFGLDRWDGSKWIEFSNGTSIGNRRLLRFETINTTQVRLRITRAPAAPVLSEVGFFLAPEPAK